MYIGNNLYDLVNHGKLSWFKLCLTRLVDFVGSGGNIVYQRANTCVSCNNDVRIDETSDFVNGAGSGEVICNKCSRDN